MRIHNTPVAVTLTLAHAQTIAQHALTQARSLAAKPIAVAVLDSGGHLQVVLREDGAAYLRPDIAIAKAWGALGMGESSRQLTARAVKKPEFFTSLVDIAQGRMGLSPGGVLIQDDRGSIIAAIGVSGELSDVDEQCAVAGIEAAGFTAFLGIDP